MNYESSEREQSIKALVWKDTQLSKSLRLSSVGLEFEVEILKASAILKHFRNFIIIEFKAKDQKKLIFNYNYIKLLLNYGPIFNSPPKYNFEGASISARCNINSTGPLKTSIICLGNIKKGNSDDMM